jgi:hypothetical protein
LDYYILKNKRIANPHWWQVLDLDNILRKGLLGLFKVVLVLVVPVLVVPVLVVPVLVVPVLVVPVLIVSEFLL